MANCPLFREDFVRKGVDFGLPHSLPQIRPTHNGKRSCRIPAVMGIFLNLKMEVRFAVRPIGNAGDSHVSKNFSSGYRFSFPNIRRDGGKVRIKRHVSVCGFQPYLISPIHVEIEVAGVFRNVRALYDSLEILPREAGNRSYYHAVRKGSHGGTHGRHKIPSMVDAVGGRFPVRAAPSGNSGIFGRKILNGNRNDVLERLSRLRHPRCRFRPVFEG